MRKLHMGTMSYGWDAMDEIVHQIGIAFSGGQTGGRSDMAVPVDVTDLASTQGKTRLPRTWALSVDVAVETYPPV